MFVDGHAAPLTPSLGTKEKNVGIQIFELFHGAVLAKIMRSYGDRPVVLRLVEVNPKEYWSVYTLNDEVHLVVKYRTRANKLSKGRWSWNFVFSPEEIH